MNVLVIDVGGSNIKMQATGAETPRKFPSGPDMDAAAMVKGVKKASKDWKFEAVSIGYPGFVLDNRIVTEPFNLAAGWVRFDFAGAFGCPVKIINDAAMQALGSYEGGRMLFLGFGTGLGSTFIVDGEIEPMELGHLPYRKATFEDYVGQRGLDKFGKKKWREYVEDVVAKLTTALEPSEVVLGGGNIKFLDQMPKGCRAGNNANAFTGGFRLWEKPRKKRTSAAGGDSDK